MEHHPVYLGPLTLTIIWLWGQFQAGSLTGAVASQKVTEALKAILSLVGNQALSASA